MLVCENARARLYFATASAPTRPAWPWPCFPFVWCFLPPTISSSIHLFLLPTRCSPVGMHDVEIKAIRKMTWRCSKLLLTRRPDGSCIALLFKTSHAWNQKKEFSAQLTAKRRVNSGFPKLGDGVISLLFSLASNNVVTGRRCCWWADLQKPPLAAWLI